MSSTPPLVAVVCRDHAATIVACLEALLADPGLPCEVIVWDDASTDQTVALAQPFAASHRVQIVSQPRQGLAKVLNKLSALAGPRDLVCVHGDAIVRTPRWLEALTATAARHPDAGVVGCKTLFPDGRIQSAGRMIVRALGIRDHHANLGWRDRSSPTPGQTQLVDSVLGTLALYRRAALTVTGGFDIHFVPAWFVDDDFCVAARVKNFDVVCDLGIEVEHRQARPDARKAILPNLYALWNRKWGWNPEFPNLHAIRDRYGATKLCWQIGRRLLAEPLPAQPPVDVVMVTWNSLARLRHTLETLARTDYPDITLHLLDNGSTDGTVEFLRSLAAPGGYRYPIVLHMMPVNLGLPPSLNLLVHGCRAPLIARLDDDIELPPHWLAQFIEDLRAFPYAGVVGAKIVNLGKPGLQGVGEPWCHPLDPEDRGQYDYLAFANHVRGCCNLYRKKAFEIAGLFDVRFNPSQFDDPDHHLALRAAGFDILYDGRVTVPHHLGTGADATRKGDTNMRGNLLKFQGKWGEDAFAVLDCGLHLAGRLLADFRPAEFRPPETPTA